MTSKIIETTKSSTHQQEDLNKLKEILIKSNYPTHMINKHMKNTIRLTNTKINKQQNNNDNNNNNNNNNDNNNNNNHNNRMKYQITLPFVNGIEVLKRKLEQLSIKVFFSYPSKIKTTCTNLIEQKLKSNIYQITCSCGSIYNGETKIGMDKRIIQHNRKIKNKETKNSEIAQHHHGNNYQCAFDLTKAFVIDNETNWKKRRIKESIYSTINNSINRRDDINELWLPSFT